MTSLRHGRALNRVGVNDFTLDIGVEQDPLALAYSRSQLVVAPAPRIFRADRRPHA